MTGPRWGPMKDAENEAGRLAHNVDAYVTWRKDIFRELTRYRSWLGENRLLTEELDHRLNQALDTLREDRITLAFVGEFSRGKTELINALFFSQYGTRILPSGVGRTTMCPTELFYDQKAGTSYIRLLPIETRMGGSSVAGFKKIPDHWVYMPLDLNQPEAMKKAFGEVANTKSVNEAEATAMGFQTQMLERSPLDPKRVMVPAWRHALISFDHPLLRRGLSIIDTPGLNALGCEPELTFSLLPEAQAILFLLSASTGVTSTDLEMWNRHIRDLAVREYTGVYAILNKIDSLWDELESDAHNHQALTDLMTQCARFLSVAPDEVIPVSAREGLLAKIDSNERRLRRSNLPALEGLLSQDMMRRKEMLMQRKVVNDIVSIMHGSRKALKRRRESVMEQLEILRSDVQDKQRQIDEYTRQTRTEQAFYHKKLILLKTSRKTLEREGEDMLAPVSETHLDNYLKDAARALTQSWTIVGMNNAMDVFFDQLRNDMQKVSENQLQVLKTVADIYARYEVEQGLAPIEYPKFHPRDYLVQLDDLRAKSGSFRRSLKKLLTEQRATSKRFLSTIANEGSTIYRRFEQDARQWIGNVLLPIFQNVQEQKQLLDDQIVRLKTLAHTGDDLEARKTHITAMLAQIDRQIVEADSMLKALRKPAPYQQNRKVIPLLNGIVSPGQSA